MTQTNETNDGAASKRIKAIVEENERQIRTEMQVAIREAAANDG